MKYIVLIGIFIFITIIFSIISHFSKPDIYLTMTTIPERLINPWFYDNLKNTLNLNGNYNILLNIPYIFKKTGEEYVIPNNIKNLKNNKLIINRLDKDYGPISKLFGALLNNNIPDNSPLLICDDDITYKKNFVNNLYKEYVKDDTKLYSSCYASIQGYIGFMVKKSIIKPILNYKIPDSCIRIDDNYIEFIVNKLKINVVGVPYYNDNSWSCSLDKNIHDNHTPNWTELKEDNRPPMISRCIKDIIIDNKNL